MNFKFVISEPETRRSYQLEVDQNKAINLVGKKIGEDLNGEAIGLSGYTLKITGGTDKDGFPMHPSIKGSVKKKILLAGPPAFHPKIKGQRKRKMVRGDTISQDIVQINIKVVKKGEKPLDQLVPMKPKEKKEEKPKEQPQPEKKEEKVKGQHAEKKEQPKAEEKPKVEEKKEAGGAKTTEDKAAKP